MQQTTVGGGLAFKKGLKSRRLEGLPKRRPSLHGDALELFSSIFEKLDTHLPLYYHVTQQEREKENESENESEKETETEQENEKENEDKNEQENENEKEKQENKNEKENENQNERKEKNEVRDEYIKVTESRADEMTVNIFINNNNNYHFNNNYEVWSRDVGMMVWERNWMCIQVWVDTVAFDIHAALSDQENLHQLHLDPFHSTPLSFFLYTAIYHGAWIMNDTELENECWMRARHMAGELFDEPDYNTATALLFLGSHALFAKADRQAAAYYNRLAETMCEHLQYTNSEVYIRALTFSHLIHPTMKGVLLFQEKVKKVQQEPYHFVMTSSLLDNLHAVEMSDLLGDISRIESYNRKQLQLQRLLYMLLIVCSITRCPEFIDPMLLYALGKRVKKVYSEWVQPGSQEGLKPSRVYGISLLFPAMLVELYTRLGEHRKALHWAALYLSYAQDSLFEKLPPLCSTSVAVLQCFARSEATFSQLRLLLQILIKLQPRYMILTPILQPYSNLLTSPSFAAT